MTSCSQGKVDSSLHISGTGLTGGQGFMQDQIIASTQVLVETWMLTAKSVYKL